MNDKDKEMTEAINARRAEMGTLPVLNGKREDVVHIGLSHINVKMVAHTENPYRAIYEMASATWGNRHDWIKRWDLASEQGRMDVVMAALSHNTLPNALEAPAFTFNIEGCSRSAFDQIARHRNMSFGSVGMRDNNHEDGALILPVEMGAYEEEISNLFMHIKDVYSQMIKDGNQNWQNARVIMPMGLEWRFCMSGNYRAFQDFCSQRLAFHEQCDTVAVAWLIRHEIAQKFPLLGAYLRPVCDHTHKCVYSKNYSISECFGCLFAPCGRWPAGDKYKYATWNTSCTTPEQLMDDLGIYIPKPDDWEEILTAAIETDRRFFE